MAVGRKRPGDPSVEALLDAVSAQEKPLLIKSIRPGRPADYVLSEGNVLDEPPGTRRVPSVRSTPVAAKANEGAAGLAALNTTVPSAPPSASSLRPMAASVRPSTKRPASVRSLTVSTVALAVAAFALLIGVARERAMNQERAAAARVPETGTVVGGGRVVEFAIGTTAQPAHPRPSSRADGIAGDGAQARLARPGPGRTAGKGPRRPPPDVLEDRFRR